MRNVLEKQQKQLYKKENYIEQASNVHYFKRLAFFHLKSQQGMLSNTKWYEIMQAKLP